MGGLDWSFVFMCVGFALAAYSIIANDAVQTLGTFISSNAQRPWWQLWVYSSTILVTVILISWFWHSGDVSHGRLSGKFPIPSSFTWIHVVPPIFLLILTRYGIPVSTTFLILPVFAPAALSGMLYKSLSGYAVAFVASIIIYWSVAEIFEKKCRANRLTADQKRIWFVLQWLSTGFLWSQWLIQDLANIFVYSSSRSLDSVSLFLSLLVLVLILAFVFYSRGGAIQNIVNSKTNTVDIRSATVIDFIYALILLYFKTLNSLPMSTTWTFLGLLAGREIALTLRLKVRSAKETVKMIQSDGFKAAAGLLLSVLLASGLPRVEALVVHMSSSLPIWSARRAEPIKSFTTTERSFPSSSALPLSSTRTSLTKNP